MSGKKQKQARREAKQSGVVEKKVYTLTEEQINHIKSDAVDEAANKAMVLMLSLPAMVLRDKYRFGKKRLSDFTDYVLNLYDSFDKGYITFEDCLETIKEETGVSIVEEAEKKRLF